MSGRCQVFWFILVEFTKTNLYLWYFYLFINIQWKDYVIKISWNPQESPTTDVNNAWKTLSIHFNFSSLQTLHLNLFIFFLKIWLSKYFQHLCWITRTLLLLNNRLSSQCLLQIIIDEFIFLPFSSKDVLIPFSLLFGLQLWVTITSLAY